MNSQHEDAHKAIYEAGVKMRRKVMGNAYVDNQLNKSESEFMQSIQELATEVGWGTTWSRSGLELKQRSFISITLLAMQGKEAELSGHIRGAINNGATELEVRETLLQTATYCGIPTGMWSFRVADATIRKLKEEGNLPE
ncbi:CMD-domain-containing protein [Cyathus striatus]|nr:CMD-domain-containing protein [Cyathus striatus]